MNVNLDSPPILRGEELDQINQMRSYLFQLHKQLQIVLDQVGTAEQVIHTITNTVLGDVTDESGGSLAETYTKLKSIIIKTAHTIERQMDELVETFKGSYLAISDFGTYAENLENTIVTTAEGVVETYNFTSQLEALDTYNTISEQYIKRGLLYFDGAVPRYGVAIGENMTEVMVNGESVIDRRDIAITIVADVINFWQNGVIVSYYKNNKLYVREIELETRLKLGNWVIDQTNGFAIKWGG